MNHTASSFPEFCSLYFYLPNWRTPVSSAIRATQHFLSSSFCQHRITHAYSPQYKLRTSSNHFKWKALASKWMCVPTLKKFHQGVQEIYTLKRRRWKHKKMTKRSCLCTIRHWGLFIYQSPSKWNKCSSLTPRLLKLAKTNSSVETKNNNKKV